MGDALSHRAPPLLHGLDRSEGLGKVIGAAYDCLFCGPASVIVFFVISGFCIYYPYRQGRKAVKFLSFLSRRYIRIMLPWPAWLAFVTWVGMTYDTVGALVGWSIECELYLLSLVAPFSSLVQLANIACHHFSSFFRSGVFHQPFANDVPEFWFVG